MANERTQGGSVRRAIVLLLLLGLSVLPACTTVVATAGSGLAGNLNSAILNQDDPELVRDGAPAYLLMLDSLVEGSPENASVLSSAAELYSAYGVVFVDDPIRAEKLTERALRYGRRAICAAEDKVCGIWDLPYIEFVEKLEEIDEGQAPPLYSFGLSWLAYIQAHSGDYAAMADLPQVEAILKKIQQLNPNFQRGNIENYLGVLNTIRPPALGGDFEAGLDHYKKAFHASGGRDLSVKVNWARYYARTLYDRELHDRLLNEVLAANPVHSGYTLFNTLAQQEALDLLLTADDYF